MQVRVDEAGHDGASTQIDLTSVGRSSSARMASLEPMPTMRSPANRDRLDTGQSGIHGVDTSIGQIPDRQDILSPSHF